MRPRCRKFFRRVHPFDERRTKEQYDACQRYCRDTRRDKRRLTRQHGAIKRKIRAEEEKRQKKKRERRAHFALTTRRRKSFRRELSLCESLDTPRRSRHYALSISRVSSWPLGRSPLSRRSVNPVIRTTNIRERDDGERIFLFSRFYQVVDPPTSIAEADKRDRG